MTRKQAMDYVQRWLDTMQIPKHLYAIKSGGRGRVLIETCFAGERATDDILIKSDKLIDSDMGKVRHRYAQHMQARKN